ncbi:MAG: hypothetical protein OQJ77_01805 [Thiovulaceae bacterium]|nr:hypothetical protein [Sulfurimonadaceae bacterium]MCW9026026.1 hypothetical protein [Sulfurimonadaceae bacterium]
MNISSNITSNTLLNNKGVSPIKPMYTEKLTKDEVKEIKEQIVQNSNAFTFNSTNIQVGIFQEKDDFLSDYEEFQSFLKDIGYGGKSIAELSQDEAAELVSEDGFFGIKQTSERIANFVINGANGNENLLRAGREGMLEGFKQAEEIWGGELPEISQKTMSLATEIVDKAMTDLGFSIIDKSI